jgi:hypothetical protein
VGIKLLSLIIYLKGGLSMQKTKLGITVGLLGAGLYFLGLLSFLGLIILSGYVLLFETNEWLRITAVKAVAVVIGFALISTIFTFGNDIFNSINGFLSWIDVSTRLSWPINLDTIGINLINALEKIVLIILGFKAFGQGSIKVGPIDKVVNKNM